MDNDKIKDMEEIKASFTKLQNELVNINEKIKKMEQRLDDDGPYSNNTSTEAYGKPDKKCLEILATDLKNMILEEEKEKRQKTKSRITILSHPMNQNFKFYSVVDNISSNQESKIIDDMNHWFITLEQNLFKDANTLYLVYLEKLKSLFSNKRATYAGVILTEEKTIITSIGKKEIYTYHDGKILLLDKTNFKLEPLEENEELISSIIKNDDYITLMLSTDGNLGNILDDKVKIITKKTDRDELAKELLESKENLT